MENCYYFPKGSAGKESASNAGDSGLIPRLGSSPGEGIGYPLQYSWAPLVAQTVKNLLAMRETWVWSLGWKDRLEECMTTHSSILALGIPMNGGLQFTGSQRVRHDWATNHSTAHSWLITTIEIITIVYIYYYNYTHTHTHTHTYIFIHREREGEGEHLFCVK